MWHTLSTRVVFSHPRHEVHEDQVRLPDGRTVSYLKVHEAGLSVTLLCRRASGEILLQREYSYPPNRVMLDLPGGHVPEGEAPEIGANRELMEEVGYQAGRLTLLGEYFMSPRRSDHRMLVYLADDLTEATLPGDPEEQIETVWVAEREVDDLIRRGEIVSLSILAAWSLYRAWQPAN